MKRLFPTLLLATALALLAAPAARTSVIVTYDNLKCYKIKDSLKKQSYTADLTGGLVADAGCVVKLPAKMLCNAVGVANLQPQPESQRFGQNLSGTLYVCYKLKCPKISQPVSIVDGTFGNRQGTVTSTKLLCAPASTSSPAA